MANTVGGSVVWDLDVDKGKLTSGLSAAQAQVENVAGETNKRFSSMADNIAQSFDKASRSLTSAGSGMIALGAAPAAALGLSIKRATEFETTMSNISTLISGDSTDAVNELSEAVLEMSKRMPKSIDELGGSLYDILSAGISGTANQMAVLESSAKLATAGLGDTKGATDIMTSAINAFQLEASQANRISDILFKTVKFGKTTVDQMAMSFGATAPVIASAKITLEEFSAATAALTTTGLPASQAQNSLRQAVVALQKPTADMTELFAKAGITSGQAALEQEGLVSVMQKVTKAAGGNSEALAKAWGSVEALGASTALTGQVYEAFDTTMASMTGGADAVTEAFEKQRGTTAAQMTEFKNNMDALSITIGQAALPALNKLLQAILPLIQRFADFAEKHPTLIASILVIGTSIAGLGVVFVALGAVIGSVGTVMTALAPVAASLGGAVGAISLPVLAVIGAVTALIAVGVLLYKNWDKVKSFAQSAWSAIGDIVSSVAEVIKMSLIGLGMIIADIAGLFADTIKQMASPFVWLYQNIIEPIALLISAVLLREFYIIFNVVVPQVQNMVNIISAAWSIVRDATVGKWNEIKTFFTTLWSFISSYASAIWNQISQAITRPVSSGTSTVQNAFSSVWNYIQGIWNSLLNFLSGMGGRIIHAITQPFRDAKAEIERVAQSIRNAADRINPFHRESPSLVDNVKRGIGIIQEEFSSLGNMSIPAITGQFADPLLATVGSGTQEGATTTSNQNIIINNYIDEVRDRSDIDALNRQMGFQLMTQ